MERLFRYIDNETSNANLLLNALRVNNLFILNILLQQDALKHTLKSYDVGYLLNYMIEHTQDNIMNLMISQPLLKNHIIDEFEKDDHEKLFTLIGKRKLNTLRRLLLFGISPTATDKNNRSIISAIISLKNTDFVELLIDYYDVDPNGVDENGNCIIFKALDHNLYDISSVLMNASRDLNVIRKNNETLLEYVVKKNLYMHTNFVLRKQPTYFYDDEQMFYRLCNISVCNGSSLIVYKLIVHFFASRIQRYWRKKQQQSKISIATS